jgi:hypothetical protein
MKRVPSPVSTVLAASLAAVLVVGVGASAAAPPEGQLTWAVALALAPAWFDPRRRCEC